MLPFIRFLLASLCHRRYAQHRLGVTYQRNMLGMSKVAFRPICNQPNAVIQFHDYDEPPKLDNDVDTGRPFQYVNQAGVVRELGFSVRSRLGGSTTSRFMVSLSIQRDQVPFASHPRPCTIPCSNTTSNSTSDTRRVLVLKTQVSFYKFPFEFLLTIPCHT